ncbi:transposase [Brumimicrobium mesophilum]|uniref:transposase n=1 Tax=Brumimicrobium mesophilum TaxID=392717 RepID=UPI000D14089A|nr:transposase [Brumimicrobium mesophilum]
MSEKFKNRYRTASHRKLNWNYSANGYYFLTIVTQDRVCNLGEVKNDKMVLSEFGEIVRAEFQKSFEIRSELIQHEEIVMPNHIHALVEIDQSEKRNDLKIKRVPKREDYQQNHEAYRDLKIKRNRPVRLPQSISSFIAGFKSAVNTKIDDYIDELQLNIPKYNRNNHFFQPNYHDHVIRNDQEYQNIKYYIRYNPENWNYDRLKDK